MSSVACATAIEADPCAIRTPRTGQQNALATAGPVLLGVLTNPDEVSLPPKVTPGDAWGFAIAKLKETLTSRDG